MADARLGRARRLAMEILRAKTERRTQLVDVTTAVDRAVKSSGVASGICYVYVPHTTAGGGFYLDAGPEGGSGLGGGVGWFGRGKGAFRKSGGGREFHVSWGMVWGGEAG